MCNRLTVVLRGGAAGHCMVDDIRMYNRLTLVLRGEATGQRMPDTIRMNNKLTIMLRGGELTFASVTLDVCATTRMLVLRGGATGEGMA